MKRFLEPGHWLVRAALACGLLACNAQVDPDYHGEPIATLRGNVVAKAAALSPPAELTAAIIWMSQDEVPGGYKVKLVGERVDVRGDFPAAFELNLYAAPSEDAMMTALIPAEGVPLTRDGNVWTVPQGSEKELITLDVAWGFLAAIDASADLSDVQYEDIIGIDTKHVVLYFANDVTPLPLDYAEAPAKLTRTELPFWSAHVRVAQLETDLGPGYHLAKRNPESIAWQQEYQDCFWQDLCVHWTNEDPAIAHSHEDWELERCTQRFPENPTCTALRAAVEDEPAASRECREMHETFVSIADCYNIEGDLPAKYVPNPDGLNAPLEIELGMGMHDLY